MPSYSRKALSSPETEALPPVAAGRAGASNQSRLDAWRLALLGLPWDEQSKWQGDVRGDLATTPWAWLPRADHPDQQLTLPRITGGTATAAGDASLRQHKLQVFLGDSVGDPLDVHLTQRIGHGTTNGPT